MSFTALSTVGCLAKGVLYGLNLIGGWLPVSILMLIVLVFPKLVSFFAKRSTFCSIKSSIACLWLIGTLTFCFKSSRELTLREVCCSHWLRSLTFTKLHSFTVSILLMVLPFLSQISLLVLLIRNTENLHCLLVFTLELAVSREGSLLMVLSSVGTTWWNLEFNNFFASRGYA